MKILLVVLCILLVVIPPIATGSVALPRDLDSLIRFFLGILNWWLQALISFLRVLTSILR
jgi:hypothetical protein